MSVFTCDEKAVEFDRWLSELRSVAFYVRTFGPKGDVLPEAVQVEWAKLRPTFTFLGGKAPVEVDSILVEVRGGVCLVTAMRTHLVVTQPFDLFEAAPLLAVLFEAESCERFELDVCLKA